MGTKTNVIDDNVCVPREFQNLKIELSMTLNGHPHVSCGGLDRFKASRIVDDAFGSSAARNPKVQVRCAVGYKTPSKAKYEEVRCSNHNPYAS